MVRSENAAFAGKGLTGQFFRLRELALGPEQLGQISLSKESLVMVGSQRVGLNGKDVAKQLFPPLDTFFRTPKPLPDLRRY